MEPRKETRVSAYALAVNDGQLLLTRLSDASPIFTPGLWHLPGGGIDPGEQPEAALARELQEEAGLELVDARLVAAHAYAVRRNGVDWHLVALFYTVDLKSDAPTVVEVGGSTADVDWFPLAALQESALSPAAIDGLRLLRAGATSPQ
ncbi:8-oxo-dGTP diphosphatase [Streptacidiphilus sp. BW17]|uniref:NUDIX hydrolase n=1 Tax=Streptacidiphilus sp. BW17 TaxID=3156274 RepID=UPI0035134763